MTLKATSTLPGGQPQLGPTTIAIPRNGDTTATVSLPVPPGTPIGTYDVVLTATGNSLPAWVYIPKVGDDEADGGGQDRARSPGE